MKREYFSCVRSGFCETLNRMAAKTLSEHLAAIGRKGGKARTVAQKRAMKENFKKRWDGPKTKAALKNGKKK